MWTYPHIFDFVQYMRQGSGFFVQDIPVPIFFHVFLWCLPAIVTMRIQWENQSKQWDWMYIAWGSMVGGIFWIIFWLNYVLVLQPLYVGGYTILDMSILGMVLIIEVFGTFMSVIAMFWTIDW
jgi:hypothetical protein